MARQELAALSGASSAVGRLSEEGARRNAADHKRLMRAAFPTLHAVKVRSFGRNLFDPDDRGPDG